MAGPAIGTVRVHAPVMRSQDDVGGTYPAGQFALSDAPPTVSLAKGTRTLVPLLNASTRSFQDFTASRVDVANSRVMPTDAAELLTARLTFKVIQDPAASSTLVGTLMTTVSGLGVFTSALNSNVAMHIEADTAPPASSNSTTSFFADTQDVSYLPWTCGITVPVFGFSQFLANGCRFYVTCTTSGLALTDPRLLLVQHR